MFKSHILTKKKVHSSVLQDEIIEQHSRT